MPHLRGLLLSRAEHELLCKFKWEGFEANELVGMNAGNTTNAIQMRLKRIIKRLRRTVVTSQPDGEARPECSEAKNISTEATIFFESMPISNSEKGFSPELSRPNA